MNKTNVLESIHRAVRLLKSERDLTASNTLIKVEGKNLFVRAYSEMLERVIINVIKNSLEAISEANRQRGLIRIRSRTETRYGDRFDKWVRIEISDNGCGIREADISKVTTLFTTRADAKPNSGIGMFISSRIMEIHSGIIEIDSLLDKGTTVSLVLPEWNAYLKLAAEISPSDDNLVG
jgi:signal transduction histidine kinase